MTRDEFTDHILAGIDAGIMASYGRRPTPDEQIQSLKLWIAGTLYELHVLRLELGRETVLK